MRFMEAHRHQRIEHGILRLVVQCTDHLGYPTDLSGLSTAFRPAFPDIENRELVDTLKRLNPKHVRDGPPRPGVRSDGGMARGRTIGERTNANGCPRLKVILSDC